MAEVLMTQRHDGCVKSVEKCTDSHKEGDIDTDGEKKNRDVQNEVAKQSGRMGSFFLVFLILFFDLIAFTIILPLFPSIIDYYGKHDSSDATLNYIYQALEWIRSSLNMPDRRRYNNVLVAGILGSLYSFLQFLSSPIIGACSDAVGRRKVLILSMIGSCLSYVVWWKAETFSLFILSRVIAGLSKGSVTLCTAIVSDVSRKEERGKGMAFIGLAFSCGFISGPLIGAYFSTKSGNETYIFALPAQIAILFQIVSLLLTMCLLKETKPKQHVESISYCYSKVAKLTNPLQLFSFKGCSPSSKVSPCLQQLIAAYFLFLLFFSGLEFTLPFLTHERFNFTGMQQGKLLFFAGIIMMLVQGVYVRRMKQNREKKIALQGVLLLIPSMILFSCSTSVEMTYIAMAIYSFGAATVVPCMTSLFTQQSAECDTGENIGVLRSAGALARAVAPGVSCSVYWSFGSSICYATGAVLFIIPLFILIRTDVNISEEKAD